jgi:hypothetical protein
MSLNDMTLTETQPLTTDTYIYNEADFDGHNSAPLLIIGDEADPRLIARQDQLHRLFEQLARSELGSYVKPSVIDFVIQSIQSRMNQREGLNGMSYINRKYKYPQYSEVPDYPEEYVLESTEESKYGGGIMLQKEIARQAFGSDSTEFGNITMIADKRKEQERSIWEDAGSLVGKDATPKPEDMYSLQVLGFDRDIRTSAHIGAMRIGMKRYLGVTEFETTVKARTTAIINTSPSAGFDPDLIELFRDTAIAGKKIAELPEFKKAVSWLVESELPSGLVLARNETVYGTVSAPNI